MSRARDLVTYPLADARGLRIAADSAEAQGRPKNMRADGGLFSIGHASPPNNSWSLLDDIAFHGAQRAQQRILLRHPDLEFIERTYQVLNETVEIRARDAHAHVSRFHVFAHMLARSAGCHANLVHQ